MLLLLLFVLIVQFRMQILQVLVCIIHDSLNNVWFPLIVMLLQDQQVSDYYWHSSRSVRSFSLVPFVLLQFIAFYIILYVNYLKFIPYKIYKVARHFIL